uniref:glucuronosyltransferase n=1 Tax=Panagrolaimus davidi TaxID=227884 RepID=A0A914Q4X5_9BILA
MKWKKAVFFLSVIFVFSNAYKIAIFTPDVSASQLIFNKRVAETFAKAGHEVKMFRIRAMGYKHIEVHVNQKLVNVADVIAYSDEDFNAFHKAQGEFYFSESSVFSTKSRQAYQRFADLLTNSCSELLQMTSFMLSLKEENFDIAFAASTDYCSIGLIHASKIPTWIWLDSGPLTDFVAENIGVTSPPSFVPLEFADSGDKMTFMQRCFNLVLRGSFPFFYDRAYALPQNEIFKKYVDYDFPDLRDLAKNVPLVMTNTHEFYDFQRPTLSKIINLGGLGLSNFTRSPLPEPFKKLIDKYDTVILFSFGTVADASQMSKEWKETLLKTFSKFSNILFIFRYLEADLEVPENVHLTKWMPQFELLNHPKTKLIIFQGGYSTFQEAIYASKPMIVIPLFGDQKRNANLIKKFGIGMRLDKSNLNEDSLFKAIKLVLESPKYSSNVAKLNAIVSRKPFSAEEKLLKWTDFLVEIKNIANLTPITVEMSFIEYHNLDVFGFCILTFIAIFWLLLSFVNFIRQTFFSMKHQKEERHEKNE